MVSTFLYVPNLIGSPPPPAAALTPVGYARVAMAVAAFHYIRVPGLFLPLYSASCLLDALDGHAARYLGQCSGPPRCAAPSDPC